MGHRLGTHKLSSTVTTVVHFYDVGVWNLAGEITDPRNSRMALIVPAYSVTFRKDSGIVASSCVSVSFALPPAATLTHSFPQSRLGCNVQRGHMENRDRSPCSVESVTISFLLTVFQSTSPA
jgi:hypothetical protein